ncbi:MAG TPA: FAD-dependent oxidoreductase [Candidatus Methylacidiphilales bacterium]
MKSYSFPARELSLDDSWDVIVVGGGPAGCTAATAAAREGARTLLLESSGALGGMGTSALVPAWTPFSNKEKIIYRGLAEKVFRACSDVPHIKKDALDWVAIDPERLKRIYDTLVTEAGATVLFHTHLSAVERSGNKIETIIVTNKAGLSAYRAKVFIDCTGDADLSAWAGIPFQMGNSRGEKLMPATHCFALANVDEYALQHGPNLFGGFAESPINPILASGRYPLIPDRHLCANTIGPGVVGFNAGHIWGVDSTKPETVSAGLIEGRKMADQYRAGLAEFHPTAFGNAFLVMTGAMIGIRESRRIVGDYMLTLDDYLARRSFPDEICRNSYFIDVHLSKEEETGSDGMEKDADGRCMKYAKGESHGIPYRCLIPQGVENVLVAGRSISCEQIVQGSVRVMPVCLAMGEAAGMAGALAAGRHEGRVRDVPVGYLRTRLREMGAYLPDVSAPASAR